MQLEQQETFTIHGPQLEVLGEVEAELAEKFRAFGSAVNTDSGVTEAAEDLLETLAERNKKCKAAK